MMKLMTRWIKWSGAAWAPLREGEYGRSVATVFFVETAPGLVSGEW